MADINAIIAQGFDPGKIVQPFIDAPKNALAMKMAQSQLAGNESENALRKAQIDKIGNEQEQQAKLQTYAKMAQISQKHAADVQRDPMNLKAHNASAKMLAERMGVGQYWQDAMTPEQALQEDAALQQQYSMMLGGDVYGTTPLQTVHDGKTIASYPSKYAGIDPKVTTQDGLPPSVESSGISAQARMDAASANNGIRQLQLDMAKEKRAQQQDQNIANKVENLSKRVTKDQLPEMESSLGTIEGTLRQVGDKGDLPGFGATAMVPNIMLSSAGQDLRQQVQSLSNVIIKSRSGAAVTDQELKRFLLEAGQGKTMGDDQLRHGIGLIRKWFDQQKAATFSGYDKDVVAKYQEQYPIDTGLFNYNNGAEDKNKPGKQGVVFHHPALGDVTEEQIMEAAKNKGISREQVIKEIQGHQ